MELGDIFRCFEAGNYLDNLREDLIIIMQYTGLKDKLGKEIYEGDVVKYSMQGDEQTFPMEVDMFNLRLGFEEGDPYMRIDTDVEILGNIYENPELLQR